MAARVLVDTSGLSREDWLGYRRMGVGGSDASVICGVNRFKSPVELWQEKTGQIPDREAGEAAYWGTQLESLVRAEFTKRTGIEVITVNKILQSKLYPHMLANVDGVCRHPEYGKCVFEAKTANAFKVGEWENDAVPYEYILQVQHYMSVVGYDVAFVAVLIGGNTFQWRLVERDEEIISMLIRYETDFWSHVEDDVPPPPDGSQACAKFLGQRFPNSIPQSRIVLPDSAVALIEQFDTAKEQAEKYTELKREAENRLKQMLGDNEVGIIGENSIRWQTISKEGFDSKLLKDEQPSLYSQYTNQMSYRRFTVRAAA